MSANCTICDEPTSARSQQVRSGKMLDLFHCPSCNFEFFDADPTDLLAANKLDESRLEAAGLAIPDLEKDFANGLRQSEPLIQRYLDAGDRDRNILEIGCSWGYFLKLVRDRGSNPYGIELSSVRAGYVNNTLGIPCHTTLEECEGQGVRFKQIFLFYVLEYVPEPVQYLSRLLNLLDPDGRIVLITPNLNDPLKDIWNNQSFGNFFYDECAVNYFTPQSVHKTIERLPVKSAAVTTQQGYSFVNQVSWHLTGAPRTTGMVGGDYYIQDIIDRLSTAPHVLGSLLAERVQSFDADYRQLIEQHENGNQIHVVLEC
jgi:2-polyprenyl-3-methyl-5-hydroxy-6-metoxy-1,4-benzoquinol methylase